jgi:hypothetical protein
VNALDRAKLIRSAARLRGKWQRQACGHGSRAWVVDVKVGAERAGRSLGPDAPGGPLGPSPRKARWDRTGRMTPVDQRLAVPALCRRITRSWPDRLPALM